MRKHVDFCCSRVFRLGILVLAASAAFAPTAAASPATLVTKAAKELFKQAARTGGQAATRELAERFGREGVEEILDRALREGGEAAVDRVVRIGGQCGARGLHAVAQSPSLMSQALESLPKGSIRQAVNAVNRQPALMQELVSRHGARALGVELAHPGVGGQLVRQFGDDAIRIGERLDTNQMIRFARHSDDIAALPPEQKGTLINMLGKKPARVLDALETHPNVLGACKALGITAIVTTGVTRVGNKAFAGTEEETYPDGRLMSRSFCKLVFLVNAFLLVTERCR